MCTALRDILLIVAAIVVGVIFSVSFGHTAEITFENCMPGTRLGIVRFLEEKTDFEYVKNGQLMQVGSLVLDLRPGDYGVTYKAHNASVLDAEFREIVVGNKKETHYFGCEE